MAKSKEAAVVEAAVEKAVVEAITQQGELLPQFENAIVTKKGLSLLTKLILKGKPLQITRAAISGSLPEGDLVLLPEFENEIPSHQTGETATSATVDLQCCTPDGDNSTAIMRIYIQNGDTAFQLRQIGIMANDPDEGEIIFARTVDRSENATPFPSNINGANASVTIDIAFFVSNVSEINANITLPAEVTLAEFNAHKNNVDKRFDALYSEIRFLKFLLNVSEEATINVHLPSNSYTAVLQDNIPSNVHDRFLFYADITMDNVDLELNNEVVATLEGTYSNIPVYISEKDAGFPSGSGQEVPIFITINPRTLEIDLIGEVMHQYKDTVFAENGLIYIKIGVLNFDVYTANNVEGVNFYFPSVDIDDDATIATY